MVWDRENLTEDEIDEFLRLETALTFREAIILVALELGTYNRTGVGSTMGEAISKVATPESRLLAMGLLRRIPDGVQESIAPTPKGSILARRWSELMDNVLSQDIDIV